MSSVSQLTMITDHPIPIDEGRAEDLQHSNPMFEDEDDILHPDELHERYKEVLGENDEWRVFRSHLYGHSGYVFLWNHQLGYGIRIYDVDSSFQNFADVVSQAAEGCR
jgi:hypothetical protein